MDRAYGWFVGWAEKGEEKIVFARFIRDESAPAVKAGLRARDAFLQRPSALLGVR